MNYSYYLACLETHHYVWIGSFNLNGLPGEKSEHSLVISLFGLLHRGKSLLVVGEEHPIIEEGTCWNVENAVAIYEKISGEKLPSRLIVAFGSDELGG